MKTTLFFGVFFLLFFDLNAQGATNHATLGGKDVVSLTSIRLIGGINRHSIYRSGSEFDYDGQFGYLAGVNTVWQVKRVQVSLGLHTEIKGTSSTFQTTYFDDQSNPLTGSIMNQLVLKYLVVPLNFYLPLTSGGKVVAEVGVYAGYLYKAKSVNNYSWQRPEAANAISEFARIDFGLNTSLTFKFFEFSPSYQLGAGPYVGLGLSSINASQGYGGLPIRNYSFGFFLSISKIKPT